jgi:hypothetical protein
MEAVRHATTLLARMRQTPMRRGGRVSDSRLDLRDEISGIVERQGVLPALARRVAFQLILKFDDGELGDRKVWSAIGSQLRQESDHLITTVGLVERQVVVALPKLSALRIEALRRELAAADATVARTILNVALDAADPPRAARRYLAAYHRVAKQFEAIDAEIARTVANATFMAAVPRTTALAHARRFAQIAAAFRDDVTFARTVARVAFRSPDPIQTANEFVRTHDTLVRDMTAQGVAAAIARTLAGIASVCADPPAAARRLLAAFQDAERLVSRTHPAVARTIALSACRAADPVATARIYMQNYDAIVRIISRADPQRAREVAAQAFRSDDPLRWAKRYLAEIQTERRPARHRG